LGVADSIKKGKSMASCYTFHLEVNGDLEARLEKLRSQITESGGQFDGDTQSGTFSGYVSAMGSFQGEYEIVGNTVAITITKKPFLISCPTIEPAKACRPFTASDGLSH